MGEVWNKGVKMWDTHWKYDPEFMARQVAAIDMLPGDTVHSVANDLINTTPRPASASAASTRTSNFRRAS